MAYGTLYVFYSLILKSLIYQNKERPCFKGLNDLIPVYILCKRIHVLLVLGRVLDQAFPI